MKLSTLLEELSGYKIFGKKNYQILGVFDDSRKVKKGSLFVAIKGLSVDGHKFIPEAIQAGVRVIVGQKPKEHLKIPKGIVYLQVENSRKALGLLASAFYGHPCRKLKLIGVTGTDGKTTTASLIYNILETAGKKVGLVTTLGVKIGDKEIDTGLHVTSPDSISLQRFLSDMVKARCEYAVIEVTSHGLDQERVSGVEFDSAVLTNITHEHLDYHKTFEEYRDAKAKLLGLVKSFVVLNKDDESFEYVSSIIPQEVTRVSYGIKQKSADLFAQNIFEDERLTSYEIVCGVNSFTIKNHLPGEYNVSNSLAAISTVLKYGVGVDSIKKALYSFKAPAGRMEKIETKKGFEVYIDFAHTPNSLEKVLSLLKTRLESRQERGRLISVFGCASERDIEKRSLMGEISVKLADFSVFTAEDPRSEKVDKIISQIVEGTKKAKAKELTIDNYQTIVSASREGGKYFSRIPERGKAISFALQKLAKKGDIVIVCGKGHEKSMAYDGIEYEWSDQESVKIALKGGVKEIIR